MVCLKWLHGLGWLDPKARKQNCPAGSRSLRASILCLTLAGPLALVPDALRALQSPAAKPGPAASVQTAPATDPASAKPGTPSNTTGNNKIKVNVQVVDVPVTVLDKQGLPVVDLTQDDFKVYEDGKPQKITYFNSEVAPPLRIGLLMDTSNSARLQLKFEKDAANGFVYNMLRGGQSQNEIFLETFDATSAVVQDFTNSADALSQKIDNLKAGGGKAVYDAIYAACKDKMMTAGPRERTRRVLVVISDGLDAQSQHSLDEAMSMAHRAETIIYTVGNAAYGFTNPGDKYLSKIAEDTGGAAFFPLRVNPGTDLLSGYLAHGQFDDMEQNKGLGAETGIYTAQKMIALSDSLDAIQRELANQYLIGYTPTKSAMDGTYRSIRVVVPHKGITVRYKPGYFAITQ